MRVQLRGSNSEGASERVQNCEGVTARREEGGGERRRRKEAGQVAILKREPTPRGGGKN